MAPLVNSISRIVVGKNSVLDEVAKQLLLCARENGVNAVRSGRPNTVKPLSIYLHNKGGSGNVSAVHDYVERMMENIRANNGTFAEQFIKGTNNSHKISKFDINSFLSKLRIAN